MRCAPTVAAIALDSPLALLVVVQQVVIGLCVGFAVRIVFASVELAGEVIGLQMGLNFAGFFDPSTNAQTSTVGRFFGNTTMLLFVVMGGHLMLLQAVIATESGFDATAVSPKGAVGLMQVMPATANRFGVSSDAKRTVEQKLADPAVNVPTGTRYLRHLLDLFPGRMDLAVAAYNAGEGAVQRAGNQIPAYKETQSYVRTVLGLYAQLKPPAPVLAQRAAPGRVRMELSGGATNRGNLPPTRVAQTRDQNLNQEPVVNE